MPRSNISQTMGGIYAALATPRRANSTEVDTAAFFDYQDGITRAGVDGLVLFGSTGEFIHFDLEERIHAVTLIIKRSRIPVLVNVSHSTLHGSLVLAEGALAAGAAGLLLMPPYFYRYTDAQLLAFYRHFAELVDGRVPPFLYNLPSFTNPLSFQAIEQLLSSGVYAGIKDSSGDRQLFEQLRDLHAATPFTWFVGNESFFLEARSGGGDGIVSGVAAAIPELLVAMDRAIANKSWEHANQLNSLLSEFLIWVEKFPATVAIKQAAAQRGWNLAQFAFPLEKATSMEINTFREWLSDWLPRMVATSTEPAATNVHRTRA